MFLIDIYKNIPDYQIILKKRCKRIPERGLLLILQLRWYYLPCSKADDWRKMIGLSKISYSS